MKVFNRSSASQIRDAELCMRKWWFKYIKRLPLPKNKSFLFGNVFHSVCERYLKRKPLYPEKWNQAKINGKICTLSRRNCKLIQKIIDEAIKEKIFDRNNALEIEYRFSDIKILDSVTMTGIIDVVTPKGIEDHKTTSNWKYALDEKQLKTNRQMLIYAKAFVEWCNMNLHQVPDKILLRHNQFLKKSWHKGKLVKITETYVDKEHIENAWQEVISITKDMYKISKSKDFNKVPYNKNACDKYGGCPFRLICFEGETYEQYKSKMSF